MNDIINDELPECILYEICGNETSHDSGYCSACRTRRAGAVHADELARKAADLDHRITDGDPLKLADMQSEREIEMPREIWEIWQQVAAL